MKAVRESNGTMLVVSDNEILKAQRDLARKEGVGAEPASAASLAGYYKALDRKIISPDEKVAIILTGHSLKDPDSMGKAETKRILINPSFIEKIILEEVNDHNSS